MALMVMGVGVVTVATLFPIAILRSVQATQLTNATILRLNAEARIDLNPRLVHAIPVWTANTNYDVGDVVAANTPNSRFFRCTTAGVSDVPPEPAWDTTVGNTTTEATGVAWLTLDNVAYVVDPLGFQLVAQLDPTFQKFVGGPAAAAPPFPLVRRTFTFDSNGDGNIGEDINGDGFLQPAEDANANNLLDSDLGDDETLVTLPDSWITGIEVDDATIEPALDTVTFSASLDSADLQTVADTLDANLPVRVVVISENGRKSETRIVASSADVNLAAKQITLPTALPATGEYDNASVVIVETQERRYTWLLTVRENALSGVSAVDVVVFFRRAFGTQDEQIFENIGPAAGERQHRIDLVAGARPEFLKRGGFLLDVDNARWYRIVELEEITDAVLLTLDRRVPAGETIERAVFMRGIVDVFPIENKT